MQTTPLCVENPATIVIRPERGVSKSERFLTFKGKKQPALGEEQLAEDQPFEQVHRDRQRQTRLLGTSLPYLCDSRRIEIGERSNLRHQWWSCRTRGVTRA